MALYPNALRTCIKQAGYSFREVSKETSIPESTLYDWAAGNRVIPHKERQVLAYLLGCDVELLAPISPTSLAPSSFDTSNLVIYSQGLPQSLIQQQQGNDMDKTRRLITQAMAATGIAFFGNFQHLLAAEPWQRIIQATIKPSSIDAETLLSFDKLTEACWHLSNGNGLDQVEQLLPTYLPHLSLLAQQPSEYQHVAASIAAQGYLLSYIVASNREDFKEAQAHCQQARTYAQIAHDRNLETMALIRQGVVGLHRKRPHKTLEAYEEALQFISEVSPLVRTRLYASLCEVQGKLSMEQEALRNIGLAQENFPDDPAKDPAALYIHFSKSGLYLHEGLALLDLHKPQEALAVLLHIDGLQPKIDISERSRIDVLNQQARAAGDKGDLEQFKLYLESAVTSALKLGSELRYSEAWDTYKHVSDLWKHEPQVKSLTELFGK